MHVVGEVAGAAVVAGAGAEEEEVERRAGGPADERECEGLLPTAMTERAVHEFHHEARARRTPQLHDHREDGRAGALQPPGREEEHEGPAQRVH